MKVLISDSLSDRGVEILKKAGLAADVKTKLTPAQLIEEIPQYDGLIIRSGTKVTKDVIAAAKNLKIIGRAGSGLDNVDIPAATKRGIVVMNTPGGNTITTAEHAFALIMSMARQIPQANASVKSGKWEKNRFMGMELFNKTLGVIGVGQIGSYVAKLAQGMNMTVLAYDAYLAPENARKLGVEVVDLDTLFSRSDIITIHAPLTTETKYMINATAIQKMKHGVRIVNAARGGIINEKDLFDAMNGGKVAAAAFDVFEKEPVDPSNPLLTLENFICTPHLGAATTEAQENVAWAIADQVVDFLVRGVVRYAVNLPSVSADLLPKVQPYVELAEKIGSFIGQTMEGGIEKITIEYHGEAADLQTEPITVAALKGLLSPILEETVNYVNAPSIAKERGIEVNEAKSSDAGNFSSLLSVKVKAGEKTKSVSGAIFNKKEPRLVEIDQMSLEVIPEGHMLFLLNEDKPGVIGGLGQLLAKNQINISRMQLGREKPGGKAISVVGVDSLLGPELLKEIKLLPHVISAKQVKL
ncbi:MAG TPA: phosphoglycerate dehydrogenase [Candidatus Manganitrophaceae bacterium]|nr:phosphoglycerate dehydrogenase [Candidatus Manganitrophaceae bacterium]